MTGRLLLCPPDVQVEARAGGQMSEKAEVSSVVALRSGRGLYLSILTPAVSVPRGPPPGPIRAQLGGGRSHMNQAGERLKIEPHGNGG